MSSDADSEPEISDVDSFGTVEMNISALNHLITDLYGQAEELEEHLLTVQKPLEGTQVAQLGQLPFLEASPFRHATFKVRPPGFPGADLARRYPFAEVCALMRNHLVATGAVNVDGTVRLSPALQALFDVEEPVIGYVALLGRLRKILA
jgi:hypothetical protein